MILAQDPHPGEEVQRLREQILAEYEGAVFNLIRNYTQLIRAILLYKINARKLQKQKNELDKYDS